MKCIRVSVEKKDENGKKLKACGDFAWQTWIDCNLWEVKKKTMIPRTIRMSRLTMITVNQFGTILSEVSTISAEQIRALSAIGSR